MFLDYLFYVFYSAGVGRTGTFIAIDIALEQVDNENTIDIPAIVTKLRQQRMKLIQTDVSTIHTS